MKLRTLVCIAGLFAACSSVSYGSAMLVTDSTGFTNVVTLIVPGGAFETSPFTDPAGNTASLLLGAGQPFVVGSDTFTVTFAHPVARAGFDVLAPVGSTEGPFQLSNGDATAASSCPISSPNFTCFLGVIDTTAFTSFSITISTDLVISPAEILDFRYTPVATTVPEPGTLAVIAPLMIAALAALRLKKRAK